MSRTVPGAGPQLKTKKTKNAVPVASTKETLHSQAAANNASADKAASGRPDKDAMERQVAIHDKEIATLQAQMDALKAKIAGNDPKSNSANEQRNKLRSEMNELRDAQAGHKNSRKGTLDQMKALQDKVATKLKTLNEAKSKFPYKSAAEVDAQIKSLDKQVESGQLKLVEERKILNEISTLRKSRKTVESFSTQQESIDADRKRIEDIKAELDHPEAKAANDKYNALKQQLDDLNKQQDTAFDSRKVLYAERDDLRKKIDEEWTKKKELRSAFKAANDTYYQKMNEDKARRLEKQKAERAAYEEGKRSEINERLLEEASAPAFEREIEDTRTLIEYFSRGGGKKGTNVPTPTLASANTNGVPEGGLSKLPILEVRQVESTIPEGATALKKKGEDEEVLFGGGGGKKGKKGKKGPKTDAGAADGEAPSTPTNAASHSLQLPMPTLAALLHLNVPTPLSQADIPKTIEALEERSKWYKDNQAKTTEDRIKAAKARIAKASGAVPLPGAKKEEATPTISRRASADGAPIEATEDSQAHTANAQVDDTVESNITLANGDTTEEQSTTVEGTSQDD